MKKLISFIIITFAFFLLSGFKLTETKPPSILGPIFQASESINFTDTIDGDVFLTGADVTVNATISGDLLILAGQTDIKGNIGGDLRVIAGRADINSTVADDATLMVAQLKINPDVTIGNTFTSFSQLLDFNGKIHKQTKIFSNKVRLNGQTADHLFVTANSITVDRQADIGGNLKMAYSTDPNINPQAIIKGDLITTKFDKSTSKKPLSKYQQLKPIKRFTLLIFLQQFTTLLIEILAGSLLLFLFPSLTKKLFKITQKDPALALGWGFLYFIILPLFSLLLFLTLIGIPLGVLLLIIFTLSFYIAKLIISLNLGAKIFKDNQLTHPYRNLSLGLVILNTLKLLPVIGWLTYGIFVLSGLGVLALFINSAIRQLRQ